MKCASCDVYVDPTYMPCPQCKRRAGYTLIEDTSRCADIYDLAFTLIDGESLPSSRPLLPLKTQTIIDKNWWASATEGSLSAREIEGLAAICEEMKIDRLIGLLPEVRLTEGPPEVLPKVSLGLAFVETNEDALRNFSWDFPLSFVLFPPSLEFLLCQYSHPAVLVAGPKLLVERIFDMSIEDSIDMFKDDMENSQSAGVAAYIMAYVIDPANSSAAK
jgi:hypothetical protein